MAKLLLVVLVVIAALVQFTCALLPRFSPSASPVRAQRPLQALQGLQGLQGLLGLSLPLAETTVSEEEILDVVGNVSELPDPQLTISFAVFLLVGTALLQFSLGDLTKEEGQARVKDFLATKRETERKRGYFD